MDGLVIRMGGYQGPASVHNRAAYVLGDELTERTGGETSLTLIEDVTKLGRNSIELFDMVEGSELDLCYFASSYLVHRVPNLAVFDLPFAIESREKIYELLDNGLGEEIKADVARRTGFTVLGFWDNGFRHFTNRLHPILAPEDCQGLSIRTMNSAIHQETFRALGFHPDFIDIKDFPAAIRAEIVDAQENPLTNTVNFAVHETHRFITMSGHFCGVSLVLANAERHRGMAAGAARGAGGRDERSDAGAAGIREGGRRALLSDPGGGRRRTDPRRTSSTGRLSSRRRPRSRRRRRRTSMTASCNISGSNETWPWDPDRPLPKPASRVCPALVEVGCFRLRLSSLPNAGTPAFGGRVGGRICRRPSHRHQPGCCRVRQIYAPKSGKPDLGGGPPSP